MPFRVICANQVPDHTTICRFRQDFADEVKGLFAQVLLLCDQVVIVGDMVTVGGRG